MQTPPPPSPTVLEVPNAPSHAMSPKRSARRRIALVSSPPAPTLPRAFPHVDGLVERIVEDRVKAATSQLRADSAVVLRQLSVQANTITLMREHMEAMRNECLHFREKAIYNNAAKEALYEYCQDAMGDLNEVHSKLCERANIVCSAMCASENNTTDIMMRFSSCTHYVHQKCLRAPFVVTPTGFQCPLCKTVSETIRPEELSRAFFMDSTDGFYPDNFVAESRKFITGDETALPSSVMLNLSAVEGDACAAIVKSLPALQPLFKSICSGDDDAAYTTLAPPEYVASVQRMKRTFDSV